MRPCFPRDANLVSSTLSCDPFRDETTPNRQQRQLIATRLLCMAPLVILVLTLACGGGSSSTSNNTSNTNVTKSLSIAPVAQQLPEWCWLASGQMVFQFFQIPAINPISYQCGIIAAFYGPYSACYADCSLCDAGAGSAENVTLMLEYYSYDATGTEVLYSQFTPAQLSFSQVQGDINGGAPILAGINPNSPSVTFGQSLHLVVVVGYEILGGQDYVVVNDPFPYEAANVPDPYLAAGATSLQPGQYLVAYSTFVDVLLWNTSYDGLVLGSPQGGTLDQLNRHFGKNRKPLLSQSIR